MTATSGGNREVLQSEDPFQRSTSADRWALVWFLVVLVGGSYLTYRLALIDRWMYSHNAQVLNQGALRENRSALTSLSSEASDSRARGSLSVAKEFLKSSK